MQHCQLEIRDEEKISHPKRTAMKHAQQDHRSVNTQGDMPPSVAARLIMTPTTKQTQRPPTRTLLIPIYRLSWSYNMTSALAVPPAPYLGRLASVVSQFLKQVNTCDGVCAITTYPQRGCTNAAVGCRDPNRQLCCSRPA